MKINLIYDDANVTDTIRNQMLEPLCKVFDESHGLDGINMLVTSGLVIFEGYDILGKSETLPLWFTTIEETDPKTMAAFIIGQLRKKLGFPPPAPTRGYMGQIQIPNFQM